MIKDDGSFDPRSCRVFGLAAHTLAVLMGSVTLYQWLRIDRLSRAWPSSPDAIQ